MKKCKQKKIEARQVSTSEEKLILNSKTSCKIQNTIEKNANKIAKLWNGQGLIPTKREKLTQKKSNTYHSLIYYGQTIKGRGKPSPFKKRTDNAHLSNILSLIESWWKALFLLC